MLGQISVQAADSGLLNAFAPASNAGRPFWPGFALAAVLLVLTNWVKPTKKLHPIVFIAFSAVVGIALGAMGLL